MINQSNQKIKQENSCNNFAQIFQWNARSISTNFLAFDQYIKENNYCILALQSLNTEPGKLPKLNNYFFPPLFTISKNNGKVQTALYIRDDLEFYKISPFQNLENSEDHFGTSASVKINKNTILNVISVYYPNGTNNDNTDWIKSTILSEKKWIILGDFNEHDPLWDSSCSKTSSKRFLENITDSKLALLNDGRITRIPDVSSHRPSAIDISLASPDLAMNIDWSTEDDNLGSDHLPVILKFNSVNTENCFDKEDIITKFNYKLANWDLFCSKLMIYNIEHIKHDDVDVFYDNITKAIITAASESIPISKRKKKGKYAGNIWWTEDCKISVLNKKEKFKLWLKNKTEENFIQMKKAKIQCNKVIAKAKKDYWIDFCNKEVKESKDMNKVWHKLKEMKNGYKFPSYPIKIENNTFPTPFKKAETFLTEFAGNSITANLHLDIQKYRLQEENKYTFSDLRAESDYYINSPIQYKEMTEALEYFSNNNSAVGLDCISYQLVSHLPLIWKELLHTLFQDCWINGTIPKIWKKSVVIPVLKQGKTRSEVGSYRPIALTSNVCKLFEKIILKRLLYYCDKQNIIPVNQAGFRKGRCTLDHLITLTNQVKRQFSQRKSTLATFFDVSKAYDRVWHARLLCKLKTLGLNGKIFYFIKNLLSQRSICTRIGTTYSSFKNIDMGIPQGSIIAPLLFTLFLYDLPSVISKNTNVVQYADDIAIWINTRLRKNTKKRTSLYVQKLYQLELNNINQYMIENGLELSGDKTCLMLFNNGKNPPYVPVFELNGKTLQYKSTVKFLGIILTPKLNFKTHIETLVTKARKRLNLLKIVSHLPWGKDTKTLLHLATSLIRSKLIYGQEVYYTASKSYLQRVQSIDSKAIKIALGVPIHTNTIKCYHAANILPIHDQRKLAASKYVIRSLSVINSVKDDIFIDSEIDYPRRSRNMQYIQPINNFVKDVFLNCNIDSSCVPVMPQSPVMPPWEQMTARFDIDYSDIKKEENPNILANLTKEHLENEYPNHLKIYTDGSVIHDEDCGSGFVIPALKVQKSFYIGKRFSIFTAELHAILMALHYIESIPKDLFNILICVDSKSVLYTLKNANNSKRIDFVYDIQMLIHNIILRGTGIDFCWVPSHCHLKWNDVSDNLAKMGASLIADTTTCYNLRLSSDEINSIIKQHFLTSFFKNKIEILSCPRVLSQIIYKLRLNSWNTKYHVTSCCCRANFSVKHAIFNCPILQNQYLKNGLKLEHFDLCQILHDPIIIDIARIILHSDIYKLL